MADGSFEISSKYYSAVSTRAPIREPDDASQGATLVLSPSREPVGGDPARTAHLLRLA